MSDRLDSAALTRRALLQRAALLPAAGGVAALLAACGSSSKSSGGSAGSDGSSGGVETLKLSGVDPGGAGSVWKPIVAEDHIAAPGAKYTWVAGTPGQVQTQLLAKVVDVSVFGAVTAAEANAKGADVVLVGAALNNHGRWIVPGNSTARSPKDLRGKKIASQPPNSDTYTQAAIVAAMGGDNLKEDYHLFFGAPEANLALFQRGDVDAIIAIEPTATQLVAGGAREIARVGDLWKQYSGSSAPMLLNGRAVRGDTFSGHHAEVLAVNKMLTEANQKITANPKILSSLHQAMGIPASDRKAIELLPTRLADIYPTKFDATTRAGLDLQTKWAVKLKLLPKAPAKPVYATASQLAS